MSPSDRIAELIRTLSLRPHPEGGHYGEVYRSASVVTPGDRDVTRPSLTTIYFLLAAGERSRWHRVLSDEVWHLSEGGPLELLLMAEPGAGYERRVLAPVARHDGPVAVVPAGVWQAARPLGAYALAGCTVGPGFEFADFSLLSDDPEGAAALRRRSPELADLL